MGQDIKYILIEAEHEVPKNIVHFNYEKGIVLPIDLNGSDELELLSKLWVLLNNVLQLSSNFSDGSFDLVDQVSLHLAGLLDKLGIFKMLRFFECGLHTDSSLNQPISLTVEDL